jgi:uncharacterized membrane protein
MDSAVAGVQRPALPAWRVAIGILQTAFILAYPFIVYLAYRRFETRAAGGVLLGMVALSLALQIRGPATDLWQLVREHLGLVLLIALAILTGERFVLQLLPMAVSLFLLGTFGWSLRAGPPMVERFARLVDPDLPDFCVPYCRKVTIAWCVFLAANAFCAGWLTFAGSIEAWALYTGFVAYLLLGAAFAGEFVVRKLWFRYYVDGLADRVFARLFPAERSANGRRSLEYVRRRRERVASSAGTAPA